MFDAKEIKHQSGSSRGGSLFFLHLRNAGAGLSGQRYGISICYGTYEKYAFSRGLSMKRFRFSLVIGIPLE